MKKTIKKMIGLGMVLIMLFFIIGLLGCNYECKCKPYVHECTEECGDFCLNISLKCTRLERDSNIDVNIVFRNLSGQDLEILELMFFASNPFNIYGGVPVAILMRDVMVKNFDSIESTNNMTHSGLTKGPWGGLRRGTHTLTFNAQFLFDEELVNITSNSISITIR